MEFNVTKVKGVVDRSFKMTKIPLHKDASPKEIIKQSKDVVWADSKLACDYYMADGSGMPIHPRGDTEEEFILQKPGNEGTTSVPWTLNNYLQISNIKYPSRARLYCVRKQCVEKNISSQHVAVHTRTSCIEGNRSTSSEKSSPAPSNDSSGIVDDLMAPNFEVLFTGVKESRYSSSFVFQSGLTQEDILTSSVWNRDTDQRMDIAEDISSKPSEKCRLFLDNPLEDGFFLERICCRDGNFSFISDCCTETGEVIYCCPTEDSKFDVWEGCYSSASDNVCLMACVAINGFHGTCHYEWRISGSDAVIGDTPLCYSSQPALYSCNVSCPGHNVSCCFKIKTIHTGASDIIMVEKVKDMDFVEYYATTDTVLVADPIAKVETSSIVFSETKDLDLISSSCNDVNNLKLLDVIGNGAFGTVYKAVWRGSVVAAKVMDIRGNQKVIDNELSLYKELRHPNILDLLGIVKDNTHVTLLTNFVYGKNLYQLLHDDDMKVQMSFSTKIHIAVQLLQSLVFMHNHSPPVAHLDLKPENLLVETVTGRLYVSDFGLGKILAQMNQGRTTMRAGTPAFQPPEQLKGETCGISSDVYATGCILIELFGEVPIWKDVLPHTIILNVVSGRFPCSNHLPSHIQKVTSLCVTELNKRASSEVILQELCKLV